MHPPLATRVVRAVAEAKGIEPTELEYPLGEYIDLDAVDQLVTHENASWTLSFELPEHNVTVTIDGMVLVDGTIEHVWE